MTETDAEFVERLRVAASHPYNQHGPHEFLTKAAARIEQLEAEAKTRTLEYLGQVGQLSDEIERLRAEVKVWQGHTKTAVWSDSEECKMLSAEVERLLKSRNRWAQKYNDLLAKRRLKDGYDVYAAAREEYRKKIVEQSARIERLEAALHGVLNCIGNLDVDRLQYQMIREARAALEDRT